jgi:CRP/FNR family transcriptional regulator
MTSTAPSQPWIDGAPEAFLRAFASAARPLRLPPGQTLCHQGDWCGALPLVVSGQARVYKLGENGREITLYRIYPGESCVLTASCILSHTPFPAVAVIETQVEALAIPSAQALAWFGEHPHWRDFVFRMVSLRLTEVLGLIDAVVFRRLDSRLAALLLARAGQGDSVALTHRQLADELGSAREVISRLVKDLESRGMLRSGRGLIALRDRAALEDLTRA